MATQALNPGTGGIHSFAEANNRFAFSTYGTLASQPGNLIFSPPSLEIALSLCAAGARGETAQEMSQALYLYALKNSHYAARDFLAALTRGIPADNILSVANALWVQNRYPVQPAFEKLAKESYQAESQTLDFSNSSQAARTINQWVAQNTAQRIKELVNSSSLTPDSRIVITNAIYFKAKWQDAFSKSATKDAPFNLEGGKTVTAPLMNNKAHFPYAETAELQALALPYGGDRFSLVVVLPKPESSLAAVEKSLPSGTVQATLKTLASREVDVFLPRFKSTKSLDLEDSLSAQGIKRAFSDQADFSGLTSHPVGLKISKVIQKALVEVNEEGTEAAAATGVIMMPRSAIKRPTTPVVFRADRPFLYFIKDNASDTILFLGRLTNPSA